MVTVRVGVGVKGSRGMELQLTGLKSVQWVKVIRRLPAPLPAPFRPSVCVHQRSGVGEGGGVGGGRAEEEPRERSASVFPPPTPHLLE